VLANGVGPQLIRFVTHLDVSRDQCAEALEVIRSVFRGKA
jgi:threonine aldolase